MMPAHRQILRQQDATVRQNSSRNAPRMRRIWRLAAHFLSTMTVASLGMHVRFVPVVADFDILQPEESPCCFLFADCL